MFLMYLLSSPCSLPTLGYGSYYDGDVMAYTVEARQDMEQLPRDLSHWNGFIAISSCVEIGDTWWVRVPYSKPAIYRSYLVSDCSGHASTSRWMAQNNILLEFGGLEARKLGIAGGGGVRVEVCYDDIFWSSRSRGVRSSHVSGLPFLWDGSSPTGSDSRGIR